MALDCRGNHLDNYLVDFELLAGQLLDELHELLFHWLLGAGLDVGIESLLLLLVQTLIDLLSALLGEKLELGRDMLIVHHLDILFKLA